jgi:hypothetical protein
MPATTVKLMLGADIRRAALDEPTLAALRALVKTHFKLGARACRLLWVDDEGDRVTLTADEQVQEALALAGSGGRLLKIEVLPAAVAGA